MQQADRALFGYAKNPLKTPYRSSEVRVMDIITTQGVTIQQRLKSELNTVEHVSAGRQEAVVKHSAVQDQQALEQAVDSMQEATQAMRRDLNFSIDESSGRTVVKVLDSSTGDVIRQMPTEEALRLAESLDEMRSLLFKAQA